MGKQRDLTIVEPIGLSFSDTVTMDPVVALAALHEFVSNNGFTAAEFEDAFELFRRAATQPGEPVVVPTAWDATAMDHAARVHDAMEIMTDSPIAHGLVIVSTGAQPGTRFVHDMRDNACQLTSECTNAPA